MDSLAEKESFGDTCGPGTAGKVVSSQRQWPLSEGVLTRAWHVFDSMQQQLSLMSGSGAFRLWYLQPFHSTSAACHQGDCGWNQMALDVRTLLSSTSAGQAIFWQSSELRIGWTPGHCSVLQSCTCAPGFYQFCIRHYCPESGWDGNWTSARTSLSKSQTRRLSGHRISTCESWEW